jgi:tetratricopeptide (TPR) repeat protein
MIGKKEFFKNLGVLRNLTTCKKLIGKKTGLRNTSKFMENYLPRTVFVAEESMNASWVKQRVWKMVICLGVGAFLVLGLQLPNGWGQSDQTPVTINENLARAKVYLVAGDYRRAVEACQKNIDLNPSVEAYVYLAYVYQAIDGYLGSLVKQEDYVKVEQLALNLTAPEIIDIIDPPNVMPRMAQELIHEGIRQQFDVTAAMANRLSRTRTDELWAQQNLWREAKPDSWWAGVPDVWKW